MGCHRKATRLPGRHRKYGPVKTYGMFTATLVLWGLFTIAGSLLSIRKVVET